MKRKMLPLGCFIVMLVGFAFMGAASNENAVDKNTLWRIVGLSCITGSMAVYAWFTRHEPLTRDRLALAGVALFVVGAVLLFTLDAYWNVIGMMDIVVGGALTQKAYNNHKAENADPASAATT